MALHNQNQIDGRSAHSPKDDVGVLKGLLHHMEEKNARLQEKLTELENSMNTQQQPSPFPNDAYLTREPQPFYAPQQPSMPQYGLLGNNNNVGRPVPPSGGWNQFRSFPREDIDKIVSTDVWEVDSVTNFNELHDLIGRALDCDPVDVYTIENDDVRRGYESISSLVLAAPQVVISNFEIIRQYIDNETEEVTLYPEHTHVDMPVLAELIEAYRLACAPEREWRLCASIRPANAMDFTKHYFVYRFGPNLRTKTPCDKITALRGVALMKF